MQITWVVLIDVQDTRSVSETDWREEKQGETKPHMGNNREYGRKRYCRTTRKILCLLQNRHYNFLFLENTNIDSERKSSIFTESFFVRWTGISSTEFAYFVSHMSGTLLNYYFIFVGRGESGINIA